MAQQLTHKPHVTHVASGNNYFDPMHNSIFEVNFTLPTALQQTFQADVPTLTEQVTQVSGLDALQKTPAAGAQKFMGVDVSFLNPVLDNTYADLTITLNLNIRDTSDAFVLNIFKAWGKLGYDLADGTRTLLSDYMSDDLTINQANRNGVVWRSILFKRVLLTGITGLDTLDYTSNEPCTLQVTFRSDYWIEDMGGNGN